MAPVAKALAVALASSPFGVLAAAEPGSTCSAAHSGACLARPPVLLQTHQAVDKPLASGIVLVPPYVAPPGAGSGHTGHGSPVQQHSAPGTLSSTASAEALENFRLLKELRSAGFTCPGGRYFPPNNGELEFDCRLWQASVGHSLDMGQRNYFSHVSPEGLDPFDRSEPYGLPTFSENIAAGGATAASTLEQWKKSDGHCTNMMDAAHNRMAVGYAYVASSTYKHYWTQLFATDNGGVYTSCYTGEADPVDNGGGSDGGSDGSNDGGSGGNVGGACEDSQSNCQGWAQAGYCDASSEYEPWMEDNCKLSCNLCGGSSGGSGGTGGSGNGACGDSDSHCSHWASIGYCEASSQYASYMESTCKLSCGLCR